MEENIKNKIYNSQKWKTFLEAAKMRCSDTENNTYKQEFVEFMRKYEEEHKNDLSESLYYYDVATSERFFEECYLLLDSKKIKSILSKCTVMVLTANPIEKAIFHYMMFTKSHKKIIRILCGNTAYFVLKWDKYWVAHVHQAETGAHKNLGANTTIYEALKYFTPNVIISLGIAFGIDYLSQNIGDVIVSKRLLPYSENKRDEDKIKPDRSQDKVIDYWLQVRLVNASGFLDGVTYGDILTGGSVMSSFEEKDKICSGYTNADFIIGGEMEGDALFQYAKIADIPGVVIKGICDWGVAKNDIFPEEPDREECFKNSLQAFAMVRAIEKSTPLFHDKEIFAMPKNIEYIELKHKYKLFKYSFIVSQLIALACCFLRIHNVPINPLLFVLFLIYYNIVIYEIGNFKRWKQYRIEKFENK